MGLFDSIFGGSPNIEKLQKNRDVDGLIKALSHSQTYIREQAAHSLGGIKDARSIDPLAKALSDQNSDVQIKAAQSLKQFDETQIIQVLPKIDAILTNHAAQQRAKDEEAQKKKEAEQKRKLEEARRENEANARQATTSKSSAIAAQVVKIFEEFSVRPNEQLIDKLNALVKESADPDVTTAILRTFDFDTKNLGVFGFAIQSLGLVRDPRALDKLMEVMNQFNAATTHSNPQLRSILTDHVQRAGFAIVNLVYNGRDSNPKAIPHLMKVYDSRVFPDSIKSTALVAIGKFADAHPEAREYYQREFKKLR